MSHDASPSRFSWPVPRAELDAIEVVVLDRTREGHLVVQVPADAVSSLTARAAQDTHDVDPRSRIDAGLAAPLAIRLAWPGTAARPSLWSRPGVRERVTWLGLGAVAGLALAAAALPDGRPGPMTADGATAVPVLLSSDATRPSSGPPPSPAAAAVSPTRNATRVSRATPPSPATTPRRAATRVRPSVAMMAAVKRLEAAVSRMDARATRDVWPAADRADLVAQYTALREQRLRFERCDLVASAPPALDCRGTRRYRPRVGDHSTRTQRGTWRVRLQPDDAGGWAIDSVRAPVDVKVPTTGDRVTEMAGRR